MLSYFLLKIWDCIFSSSICLFNVTILSSTLLISFSKVSFSLLVFNTAFLSSVLNSSNRSMFAYGLCDFVRSIFTISQFFCFNSRSCKMFTFFFLCVAGLFLLRTFSAMPLPTLAFCALTASVFLCAILELLVLA